MNTQRKRIKKVVSYKDVYFHIDIPNPTPIAIIDGVICEGYYFDGKATDFEPILAKEFNYPEMTGLEGDGKLRTLDEYLSIIEAQTGWQRDIDFIIAND